MTLECDIGNDHGVSTVDYWTNRERFGGAWSASREKRPSCIMGRLNNRRAEATIQYCTYPAVTSLLRHPASGSGRVSTGLNKHSVLRHASSLHGFPVADGTCAVGTTQFLQLAITLLSYYPRAALVPTVVMDNATEGQTLPKRQAS